MKTRISTLALAVGAACTLTAISAEAAAKHASHSISEYRGAALSPEKTRVRPHGVTRSHSEPALPTGSAVNFWQQMQNEGG